MYDSVGEAEADYQLVKDLHTEADLIDVYDAAVVERRAGGKTRIVKKYEPPTRVGRVLGRRGRAGHRTARRALAVRGRRRRLLGGTAAGGTILGAVAGHVAAGMSRDDLKELGEHLDAGQAGLVVALSDMGAKVEQAMKRASKLEQRRIEADAAEIERDASAAASQRWPGWEVRELLATRRGAAERVRGELRDRGAQQCTGDDVAGMVDARDVDPLGVRSPAAESAPRRGGIAGREGYGR